MLLLFAVFASYMFGAFSADVGDMYVLAYSWQPEFCYGTTYPGCSSPEDFWNTDFTLHGLWPQYQAGGYPASCTSEAFNSTVTDDIGMDTMTQYWPNVQKDESSSDYDSFWSYEWGKHGTCSGLSQTDYFNSAISLIKQLGTPSSYTSAVGTSTSAEDIRDSFGGSTKSTLLCSSSYVSAVYTCWSRSSSTGLPDSQIECPEDVQGEDTCSSSTVTIASF